VVNWSDPPVVGSGSRRADPEKLKAIQDLQVPENKRQVRQILDFSPIFGKYSQLCSNSKTVD